MNHTDFQDNECYIYQNDNAICILQYLKDRNEFKFIKNIANCESCINYKGYYGYDNNHKHCKLMTNLEKLKYL